MILTDLRLPFDAADEDVLEEAAKRLRRAGISRDAVTLSLWKRSIDARNRDAILQVCSVLVSGSFRMTEDLLRRCRGQQLIRENPAATPGSEMLHGRPLVVGMGPAGLFCALLLAEQGYAPILIDRGDDVMTRTAVNDRFLRGAELDADSNVQFGAGGAGTFSDGKLLTRVNDPRCSYVLDRLCSFGAPEEIRLSARPHIGTDRLREVVGRMLERIREAGGELHYRCRLEKLERRTDGGLRAITGLGEFACGAAVLATGHSARDIYGMLMEQSFPLSPKPFSVGFRVEQLRQEIDEAFYGRFAGHPRLGPAEYNFSDTRGERGVYTFCMCPGGTVLAAASEAGGVVVNGMSYHARDGVNSNAALLTSVSCADYGNRIEAGIAYQRQLERAAFAAGGGTYRAPAQTARDFLEGRVSSSFGRIQPTYGRGVEPARLDQLFAPAITASLQRGLAIFRKRVPAFAPDDAVLTGVETRTSAPLRVERTEALCTAHNDLVYPCGEGAGYAGGITSAALDGIRVAQALIGRFALPGAQ